MHGTVEKQWIYPYSYSGQTPTLEYPRSRERVSWIEGPWKARGVSRRFINLTLSLENCKILKRLQHFRIQNDYLDLDFLVTPNES